jgi:6-pyruvoyltetrahydropterin/6-carboxytetrahydropterin synthase
MYSLKVISYFAAAHRLREYYGKCEVLHGHNWKVEVEVKAKDVGKKGMVIDFKVLKSLLKECLERLDHSYLNEIPPFDKENPTSELISRYIFRELKDKIPPKTSLNKITVWESETACASYWENE